MTMTAVLRIVWYHACFGAVALACLPTVIPPQPTTTAITPPLSLSTEPTKEQTVHTTTVSPTSLTTSPPAQRKRRREPSSQMWRTCEPEYIPLTPYQLGQIENARTTCIYGGTSLVDRLSRNRSFAYSYNQPIVTQFTDEQIAAIRCKFGMFFSRKYDIKDTVPVGDVLYPHDVVNIVQNIPSRGRREPKNREASSVHVCPSVPLVGTESDIHFAYSSDDSSLVQVLQFLDSSQNIARHPCMFDNEMTPHCANVLCRTTRRSVTVVAITFDNVNGGVCQGIAAQEIQVEWCSSFYRNL